MKDEKIKIQQRVQAWRKEAEGRLAIFVVHVLIPVAMSTGLSIYYSINTPQADGWWNAVAVIFVCLISWGALYRFIENSYIKSSNSFIEREISILLSEKNDEIEDRGTHIDNIGNKLVVEMTKNGTLERVSNGRLRQIANYYRNDDHDPYRFIDNVLNQENNGGIENVLEAFAVFFHVVKFDNDFSFIDVSPSLRVSLWMATANPNIISPVASKAHGPKTPSQMGCEINITTDKYLQAIAWRDRSPKAFSDAKKVASKHSRDQPNSPFDLSGGWIYKFSSACCIPIECPETCELLAILWIDTNISNTFKEKENYQLCEEQWKNEIEPLFITFNNRLVFYIWLKRCAEAIRKDLKTSSEVLASQFSQEDREE